MFKVYGPKNAHDQFESEWLLGDFYQKMEDCNRNYEIKAVVDRYATKNSKILEAGCGLAQWVRYYNDKGYDIEGVDFAKKAIDKIKKFDGTLRVLYADCTELPHKDNSIDLYLSFGVIEHLEEGPDKILQEAHRVLKDGAYAYITVPNQDCDVYFNIYSKEQDTVNNVFFEYGYTKQDYIDAMERNGFEIVEFRYLCYYVPLRFKYSFVHGKLPYSLNFIGKIIAKFYSWRNNSRNAWMLGAVVRAKK